MTIPWEQRWHHLKEHAPTQKQAYFCFIVLQNTEGHSLVKANLKTLMVTLERYVLQMFGAILYVCDLSDHNVGFGLTEANVLLSQWVLKVFFTLLSQAVWSTRECCKE